ncbi:hypothetical protein KAR91_12900 [Candidatus Pacearchaeota archaeon]|nr:hypothetical protein [Candidatus Pacearchaeota archaeon]
MRRWPALATEGSDTYSIDWSQKLATGVTLSSVSYVSDPTGGLTFSGESVASNISTVEITANTTVQQYQIKCTPVLSTGNISPISVELKVVKHKPAR